jgi:UDP-N-acetyl-D-glucosamine dehydrogenase
MDAFDSAHVLCVPIPPGVDRGADLTPLLAAADQISGSLRRGDLVLVTSICPPGTVDEILTPRLITGRGLAPGRDFALAYSPAGDPRVVAGATPRCLAAAEQLLRRMGDQLVPVSTIQAAEWLTVFEHTVRLVNSALLHEFAEVLAATSTHPYQPSPSAAAEFFAASARDHGVTATVAEAAIALNHSMAGSTVRRIKERLGPLPGRRILIDGVPNATAVRLLEQLRLEANVSYHDPQVPSLTLSDGTTLYSTERHDADIVLSLQNTLRLGANCHPNG